MSSQQPKWRAFEEAVASFAKSLDPKAKVENNVRLPDRETRRPRQRDVWIIAKLCQHYPVKLLVSCKRWKRRLSQSDVDHFNGELQSSGAQKGVLYSYAGFTRPAIEKAQKLGICCCTLYDNEPARLPESLVFKSYCCTPSIQLLLLQRPEPDWNLTTWGDVFTIPDDGAAPNTTLLDRIVERFDLSEREAIKQVSPERRFPPNYETYIEVSDAERGLEPFTVGLRLRWKIWEGKLEAHVLDGSYSFTGGEFKGKQIGPTIDRRGPSPGPGWKLLDNVPDSPEKNFVIGYLFGGNTRQALVESQGPKQLLALADKLQTAGQ